MDIAQQIAFLENLGAQDQKYRMRILDAGLTDPESPKWRAIAEMGKNQDEDNRENLVKFVEEYDWPLLSRHGLLACQAAFLVVQHSENVAFMQKFLPLIQARAAVKEADVMLAAMMEDRMLMNAKYPQKYGSQCWRKKFQAEKYYVWPVEDASNVNTRRREAGFTQTVEEYAQR